MATLDDGRWHLGIGDPTLLGWVTVAAYACATLLLLRAWRAQARGSDGAASWHHPTRLRKQGFWLALALVVGFLGLNKQLDLQSLLTEWGRDHAKANGWYENRAAVQRAFILTVGVLAPLAFALLWRLSRPLDAARSVALLGLVGLGAFVVMRAASFHHVDVLLGQTVAGLRLNGWFELSGIAGVAVGAWLSIRKGVQRIPGPKDARHGAMDSAIHATSSL